MKFLSMPFSGFYCSVHSDAIDSELELREENGELVDVETYDYRAAFDYYARNYCERFSEWVTSTTGLQLGLQFRELISPREYNFATDEIDATISDAAIAELYNKVTINYSAKLDEVASQRHTSRDGFISFYSPNWREWGAISEWDNVQLATLLEALTVAYSGGMSDHELEILETMSGNGEILP